jgi:nucleotide-binding universal stress UspA family protein
MFDDVLVLLDGSVDSARAIGPAAAIARYLDTTLRAVGFYEGPTSHSLATTIGEQIRRWGELKAEITIEPLVESVAASLAAVLADHRAFAICMSTHGRGRSAALVGSETTEVLEIAPCPVLLVGPEYGASSFRCHGPMVVAVNGSDGSHSILPAARSFGHIFDYDLEITTVVDPQAPAQFEQLQASWRDVDPAVGATDVSPTTVAAEVEGETAPVSFTVLHGDDPATALVSYAAETHATLLAMATHNRRGVERVVAGSTLADVARSAPCPILAIKAPQA